MINYKDLLILKLSGAAEWKNEVEMYIPKEMMKELWGETFTVEFLGDRKYIAYGYWENGQKGWEVKYREDLKHGKSFGWHPNGQKSWEREFCEGQPRGKHIRWHANGRKWWELL